VAGGGGGGAPPPAPRPSPSTPPPSLLVAALCTLARAQPGSMTHCVRSPPQAPPEASSPPQAKRGGPGGLPPAPRPSPSTPPPSLLVAALCRGRLSVCVNRAPHSSVVVRRWVRRGAATSRPGSRWRSSWRRGHLRRCLMCVTSRRRGACGTLHPRESIKYNGTVLGRREDARQHEYVPSSSPQWPPEASQPASSSLLFACCTSPTTVVCISSPTYSLQY
jgi:hypothetical protein